MQHRASSASSGTRCSDPRQQIGDRRRGDGKAGQSAGTELRFFSTSGSFDRILRREPEPSTAKVEGEKGKKDGQENGQERYD